MISSPHRCPGRAPGVLLLLLLGLAGLATGTLRGSITTISNPDTHGSLSQDWDARCPAQVTALGHCVASSGGILEICKGCARMAAGLASKDLALEGCVEDKFMCNGCKNNLVAYYSCGSGDEPRQETTVSAQTNVLVTQNHGSDGLHAETVTVHSSNEPVSPITVHHLVHDQEHLSSNLNIPANQNDNFQIDTTTNRIVPANTNNNHESPGHLPTGSLADHPATANTLHNGGNISHDWNLACPAHSYDLGNCVGNTGGSPELCKTCAKMAATLDFDSGASEFALDACAEEPSMCHGCRNALQTYFDCGLHHDASGGHAETVVVQEEEQQQQDEITVDFPPNFLHEGGVDMNMNTNTNIDPAQNNNSDGNGRIADAWDEACPVHAYDLETCVTNAGGILELCKSCAKMASTLISSEFALDGCAEDTGMCHGCRTSLQGYFDCGIANAAP